MLLPFYPIPDQVIILVAPHPTKFCYHGSSPHLTELCYLPVPHLQYNINVAGDICSHYPQITNGTVQRDETSLDILYKCDDNYFMSTLNATTNHINCDCNWYASLERVENCTGIYGSTIINIPGMGFTYM